MAPFKVGQRARVKVGLYMPARLHGYTGLVVDRSYFPAYRNVWQFASPHNLFFMPDVDVGTYPVYRIYNGGVTDYGQDIEILHTFTKVETVYAKNRR